MLQRQQSFIFRGEKMVVNFPNVGQLIDMESLKQLLTGNRYSAMSTSNLKSMFFALDVVDAIVFFQVMCPRIKKVVEVDDYTKLSPEVAKELVEVYKKQIHLPWYSKVLEELYSYGEDGTGTSTGDSSKEG